MKKWLAFAAASLFLAACGSDYNNLSFNDTGVVFDGTGGEPSLELGSSEAQELFSAQCAGCHNIGVTGNFFDLAGGGTRIESKFAGGASHNGRTLTADQIADLAEFVDATWSSPSSSPGALPEIACGACHGIPPDGSTAGAHAKHLALPGISCLSCHSRTELHMNGVIDVDIAGFDALAGPATATYNAGNDQTTCSNVSCHGGVTTPAWANGSLSTAGNCLSCHQNGVNAAIPELNSFFSGKHKLHVVDEKISCTDCHSLSKLAEIHFADLGNPNAEGIAWKTIGGAGTRVTTYNANATCAAACHGTSRGNWFR